MTPEEKLERTRALRRARDRRYRERRRALGAAAVDRPFAALRARRGEAAAFERLVEARREANEQQVFATNDENTDAEAFADAVRYELAEEEASDGAGTTVRSLLVFLESLVVLPTEQFDMLEVTLDKPSGVETIIRTMSPRGRDAWIDGCRIALGEGSPNECEACDDSSKNAIGHELAYLTAWRILAPEEGQRTRKGGFYPRLVRDGLFDDETAEWMAATLQVYNEGRFGDLLKTEDADRRGAQCFYQSVLVSLLYQEKDVTVELHDSLAEKLAPLGEATARAVVKKGGSLSLDEINDVLHSSVSEWLGVRVRYYKQGCGKLFTREYDGRQRLGARCKQPKVSFEGKQVAEVVFSNGHFCPFLRLDDKVSGAPTIYKSALEARLKVLLADEVNMVPPPLDKPVRRDDPIRDTQKLMRWLEENQDATRPFAEKEIIKMCGFYERTPVGSLAKGLNLKQYTEEVKAKVFTRRVKVQYVVDTETYLRPEADRLRHTEYMFAWKRRGEVETRVADGLDCTRKFWEEVLSYAPQRDKETGLFPEECFEGAALDEYRRLTSLSQHRKADGKPSWKALKAIEKLEKMTPRPVLIRTFAHNSQYDVVFMMREAKRQGWLVHQRLTNHGLVTMKLKHKEFPIEVEIRDSCRILGGNGVASLPGAFSFQDKYPEKEMMLHDAVRPDVIDGSGCLSNDVPLTRLQSAVEEFNARDENVAAPFDWEEWKRRLGPYTSDDGVCRLRDYVALYCARDVDIVDEALHRFDDMLDEIYTSLGVDEEEDDGETTRLLATDACSTAALADAVMKAAGGYEGVHAVSGPLKHYLRGFIIGGRVSLPQNMGSDPQPFLVDDKVMITDAVSLYPSAMRELAQPPLGSPRYLPESIQNAAQLLAVAKRQGWQAFFVVCRVTSEAKRRLVFGTRPVRPNGESMVWTDDVVDQDRVHLTNVSLPDFLEASEVSAEDIQIVDTSIYYGNPVDEALQSVASALMTKFNREDEEVAEASVPPVDSDADYDKKRKRKQEVERVKALLQEEKSRERRIECKEAQRVWWNAFGYNEFCEFDVFRSRRENVTMLHEALIASGERPLDPEGWTTAKEMNALTDRPGRLGEVVSHLFDLRVKAKAAGNEALQTTIKLMLNAMYGRTILQDPDTKERLYETKTAAMNALTRHSGRVIEARPITDEEDDEERTWSVISNVKLTDTSPALYHWGALVLDKSKRIMNRVFLAAEEAGLSDKLYYTDTDSFLHDADVLEPLAEEYNRLYPNLPPLCGKGLGQFHEDLPQVDGKDTVGSEALILGKKVYIVRIVNADGGVGFKLSLKGASKDALLLEAHKCGGSSYSKGAYRGEGVWRIFERMCDGETVAFDNNAAGKRLFKYGGRKDAPSYEICSQEKPIRRLKFGG